MARITEWAIAPIGPRFVKAMTVSDGGAENGKVIEFSRIGDGKRLQIHLSIAEADLLRKKLRRDGEP